jgi:TATA-box binding protein (TBP) (component of TFIID and TFIIIB)
MDTVRKIVKFHQTIQGAKPSWPKTTTITLTAKVGKSLDREVVDAVFKKLRYLPVYIDGIKTPFMWRKFNSDFYNQVSIGYTDSLSTKKVKIFPNGSLQVAGCGDMFDCSRFVRQLIFILKMLYKVDVPEESFKIAMYNSNFSLNHTIDVYGLIEAAGRAGIQCDYNPDRYSAVKMKLPGTTFPEHKVTVSIFTTGSVLLTGGRSEDEIINMYEKVTRLAHSSPDILIEAREQTAKFNLHLGYKVDDWVQAVSF